MSNGASNNNLGADFIKQEKTNSLNDFEDIKKKKKKKISSNNKLLNNPLST